MITEQPIKAIVGLGNPGKQYSYTRHNIGFMIVDALAEHFGSSWHQKDSMEIADIRINENRVILVKPQTFMNSSGKVVPYLNKQGIKPESILVIHDELELPFGKLKYKNGGSAKGHNGLRSIIEHGGPDFPRLCVGIGRPAQKEMVGTYVLQNFSETEKDVQDMVARAVEMIIEMFS